MTGEALHQRYINAMADEGIMMDPWDELSEAEQNAWQAMAEDLMLDPTVRR